MRKEIGTGYIVIPEGVNKEEYIESCFTKENFCIMTNDGGFIPNVLCMKQVLNDLKFPEDYTGLGTQVIFVNFDEYNIPVIIGTVSKQGLSEYRNEGDLNFSKNLKGNEIGFVGNLFLSKLSIFCRNLFNKKSKINIEVVGNEESELNLVSSGWVCSKSNTGFKIVNKNKQVIIDKDKILISNSLEQNLSLDDEKLFYKDKHGNKLTIDAEGYKLGNINFKEYITKILDFLGNKIILNTSMGPSAPGCSSTTSGTELQQIKTELENINKKS